MTGPRWIAQDARGSWIGIAPSSAEHPGHTDLVRQLHHGFEVLVRLDRVSAAAMASALGSAGYREGAQ